jgi:hypothetical protein
MQSSVPVYGYGNQYYSFMSSGKVIVSGSLTIGFKESGYLLWPAKRYIERKTSKEWTSPKFKTQENMIINGYGDSFSNFNQQDPLSAASKAADALRIMRGNVEEVLASTDNRVKSNFYQELGALPDNAFEDYAEAFEDAVWFGGDAGGNPLVRDLLFSNNLSPSDSISNESIYQHRRLDQYPPVDLYIVYGDANRESVNHTVKQLLDVSFIGQAQTLEVSGEPVLERYSFMARNII